ncbi:MAG: hypothetical protein A2W31_01050, partial [Planctomycetes bacterium RBG_16_64_10]
PRDPTRFCLFVVDSPCREARPAGAADGGEDGWQQQFLALRRSQAERLWQLARQALDTKRCGLALQLATEALREDPDHAPARRLLGYEQVDGQWCPAFAARQKQRGYVWHGRFGWLHKEDVPRYDAGARRFGSGWITDAEDARRRQRIANGWRVPTDHYLVTTNDGLEGGVQLAARLEQFYQIWQQLFADYCLDTTAKRRLRDSGSLPATSDRQHAIYYFRSRAEYNQALRRQQPLIEKTLGIYFDTSRRGYFFAGPEQSAETLYHEATHQLFHETRRVAKLVGRRNNFWIVEGIATYMESLAEQPGYWTVGGFDAGRMPAARFRLLDDGYYIPLQQLTRMGVDDLQRRADLAKLYSQVAGLTAFLSHYDGGRYRDALLECLIAVYTDTADDTTLATLTGCSYTELDRQYRAFLESGK